MAVKQRAGRADGGSKSKRGYSKTAKLRLLTILPITIMSIALILSFLCVYAGHKPGMMDDFAVFTLNSSRLGENLLQSLDTKIESVHFKRSDEEAVSTATTAHTTLITLAPRAVISDVGSFLSHATSAAASEGSAVASKVSSVGSAAGSAASSAAATLENQVVAAVNKAYVGLISDLHLEDFYSIHISSSCSGTYVFQNGTNVTVGASGLPADKGKDSVHKHVDSCTPHSSIDPTSLIRILYWIGVACTGVAWVAALAAAVMGPSRKLSVVNIGVTLPAFFFLGLASAVTHGLALGAARLINFIGDAIGIAGYQGNRFLELTWATTVLLSLNMLLWCLMFFMCGKDGNAEHSQRMGFRRSRHDRTSGIALGAAQSTT